MHAHGYFTHVAPRPSVAPPPEEDGTVILCVVENMMYPITDEALETVVKAYGDVVEKVIYERPGVWQAVVKYASATSANSAKQALEGHAIYEGGYNKLRVFSSSKLALAYATAAIAMPEYKLSEQEMAGMRVVVNGDDYVRAHTDIGRGDSAIMLGLPLPPAFVPTSLPTAGTQQPVAPVPVGGAPYYFRPMDPYSNGPPPPSPSYVQGHLPTTYHMQVPPNFQRDPGFRYPHPTPMTTYQNHPMPHPMHSHHLVNRNSHGPGTMPGGSERSKQV